MIRVANAPVSYGAFELTVGVRPNVPGPDEVLDAIAAAGYKGTELGSLGYFGDAGALRERLESRGLALAGAFVELRFGAGQDHALLDATLDVLEGLGAKPVLADAGPRDGDVHWDGVERAAEIARARGLEPTFHHHMGTRVQTPAEIEQLLERTSVGLLLDTGHLSAAGGRSAAGAARLARPNRPPAREGRPPRRASRCGKLGRGVARRRVLRARHGGRQS
ncbi:MAG: hypothetical protein ACR2GT_05155 [Gaiellaceae bacterium]